MPVAPKIRKLLTGHAAVALGSEVTKRKLHGKQSRNPASAAATAIKKAYESSGLPLSPVKVPTISPLVVSVPGHTCYASIPTTFEQFVTPTMTLHVHFFGAAPVSGEDVTVLTAHLVRLVVDGREIEDDSRWARVGQWFDRKALPPANLSFPPVVHAGTTLELDCDFFAHVPRPPGTSVPFDPSSSYAIPRSVKGHMFVKDSLGRLADGGGIDFGSVLRWDGPAP